MTGIQGLQNAAQSPLETDVRLTGTLLEQVRAAFYYVRSGRTVEPPDLPDRPGLEALLDP